MASRSGDDKAQYGAQTGTYPSANPPTPGSKYQCRKLGNRKNRTFYLALTVGESTFPLTGTLLNTIHRIWKKRTQLKTCAYLLYCHHRGGGGYQEGREIDHREH